MHFRNFLLLFILHWIPAVSNAQLMELSFTQLDSLQKVERRKVIVFLTAEWCNWCTSMKHTTLKERDVVKVLDNHYYFVPFDTEEKSSITFKGRRFVYKEAGRNSGGHELAKALGTGTVPTICVLNEANEIIFQYAGYLPAKEFLKLLYALQDVPSAQ